MRFFQKAKDGGPESKSTGLFLIEIKPLFSIVLLRFTDGSRDAFHTHAFSALSWVLKGKLVENYIGGSKEEHPASFRPIYTPYYFFHKVVSVGVTYAISFRGPWRQEWEEYIPETGKYITLTNGRKVINANSN